MTLANQPTNKDISRRDFIAKGAAGAAVGVGASALGGLSPQAVNAQVPRWDRTADVVVVGGGAAGLPAAIRARDAGASVIVVEENTDVGGHSMISGGVIHLGGGTSVQKKFGIV